MTTIKVGDVVTYKPSLISEDQQVTAAVVEMVELRGTIFKMDMVALKNVDHWVPAHECQVSK
jgi:hypothetical protein